MRASSGCGYAYSADGRPTGVTYPLPSNTWSTTSTVGYAYDHAGPLTGVTDFNGNQITVGSTADGLPNSLTLGSTGDTVTTSYAANGVPSSISLKNSTSTLQSFTYSDSPAGTVMSETDTPSSPRTPATYTYDAKARVTSMTPGTGSALNYSFDPSGNLTTLPTGASASYDNADELTSAILSATTTSYAYNADGQRLTAKQGSTTIASGTWDGAGRLTAYSDAAANMTAATYDGTGLRATATTSAGTQQFTWNTAAPVPQLIMDSNNAYIYTPGGTGPAEQVNLATGAISYLVKDIVGSVRGTVNSSGALTGTTSYDAWGNPQTTGGLTTTTPFGYADGYTDPTGLIYLINRYYDPATGQLTSVDPELSQTLQPYAYAADNPVILSDPTGLAWWDYGTDQSGCIFYCFTQWFDFSPTFSGVILNAIEPRHAKPPADKGELRGALVAVLTGIVGHVQAAIIVSAVYAIVVIGKLSVKDFTRFIKFLFRIYRGKHVRGAGFTAGIHHVFMGGYSFSRGKARMCPSHRLLCGSDGVGDWSPADGSAFKLADLNL